MNDLSGDSEPDVMDVQLLEASQVMGSMFRCVCRFDSVLGRPSREPADFEDLELIGYRDAFMKAITYAEQHETEEMSLKYVTALTFATFMSSAEQPAVDFDAVAPATREKWTYLVKHLWNLLGMDMGEDGPPQKHEEIIEAAFKGRLEEMGLIKKGD